MAKDIEYFRKKLTALQGALSETLEEMGDCTSSEAGTKTSPSPRKRQNRKDARVERFARMYATGSITKPKELKKGKK